MNSINEVEKRGVHESTPFLFTDHVFGVSYA